MLTIYDRQKNAVGVLQTDGYYQDVAEVMVARRLNSDYTLSFQVAMQSPKYGILQPEGLIECEGQFYILKDRERKREGMGRTVQFTCPHIMRRLLDIHIPYSSVVDESLGANISTFLTTISNATGGVFTFQVMDSIPVKDVYKWGYSNCLQAFQDLVKLYDVEFVPDNYNIKIYSKINIDNGNQYRFAKNIMTSSFKDNTDTLCTRMTGLAKDSLTIIDLPSSHLTADELARLNAVSGAIVNGVIKVPYLISQYQSSWATPDNAYFDSDFTDTNIDASTEVGKAQLLDEIRKKLAASEIPDIQIQIDPADVWKIGQGDRPTIGETVYLIDPDMEMNNISARVMELSEYPFDKSKNGTVTLANYLLKDMSDIVAGLSSSKNVLDGLLTNKSLNTSAFEAATQQAINDINASKTQVIYDSRGIVLQDKNNALNQVIMSAAGIYITTDGGTTTKAAILANKIVAEQIVGVIGSFAQIQIPRNDNKVQTLIDSTNGIKIQHWNGTAWTDQFSVDVNGNLVFAGSLSGATGSFSGSLNAASGTFTGALSGGTISIGSSNNIVKADSNGLYAGNSVFGSAPFRVDMAGNMTASSVNITGGNIQGAANINVSSNVSIGNKLIISDANAGAGIQWGTGANPIEIYIDSLAGSLTLKATSIYANNYRLDQAQTFVWG